MTDTRPKTELKKAIIFILVAAFFNTIMITLVKLAAESLPIQVILFARYLITFIIILPFIYFNPDRQPVYAFLKTKRLPLHLFRDVSGLISVLCYFYAAKHITLADATVLFNTIPFFIPLISYFWGNLKIFPRIWWGIAVGFIGIIFILHPGHELFQPATIAGLVSGFLAAIVFVGGRYLTYTEPPLRNMFYYFLVGGIFALIVIIFSGENFWSALNLKTILILIGIGVVGYLYQFFFTYGSKYAPVRLTSSFMYASVIFALMIDWLIWQVTPGFASLFGILLIILGAIMLLLLYPKDDYQKHK